MRKLLMASFAMLMLATTMLTGCKVEGEVDPDGSVSYNNVLPR